MSGGNVAYHLRPNKSIDRLIFFDFIKMMRITGNINEYQYISMGGPLLEDSRIFYAHLGHRNIVSFEADKDVVRRQIFNRPFPFIECLQYKSDEFVKAFPDHLAEKQHTGKYAIWLDYASPERHEQLQELSLLLSKLESGDIVRISLNANPKTLAAEISDGDTSIQETRLRNFLDTMEGYKLNAQPSDMKHKKFPYLIARAVQQTCDNALQRKHAKAHPVNLNCYADGPHAMLTATMYLASDEEWEAFERSPDFSSWEYRATSWEDIHTINVPALSQKEKILFDQKLDDDIATLVRDNDLSLGGNEASTISSIESYKKVHRFYPNFSKIEA